MWSIFTLNHFTCIFKKSEKSWNNCEIPPIKTMPTLAEKLAEMQGQDTSKIRNICILAHVDHGKTTLADALVASNGLISQRLAGQLRYLDSRPDEQERGITMKSSAVTLGFNGHVINLIDSPGHVDFSSEVSTAVRLCDGSIVVIDVVEGVQPQTEVVLKQAWLEGIKPVLVLNKVDRLITEKKLNPLDAYLSLMQVLENVNAVIGQLFATDVMKENEDNLESGLEEADDSDLYFSPERGNVVFASAYDGWAFDLSTFASIYAERLGFSQKVLQKTLWGDYYVNSKTKKIMKGASSKGKKPLFVSLILENIWALYDSIMVGKDTEKIQKIVSTLNIKVAPRDLRSNDAKQKLSAIFTQWLPLAMVVLNMVIKVLPSPNQIKEERAEQLMCSKAARFDSLAPQTQKLKSDFLNCDPNSDELIVFVSKMFPVPKKQLPQNRPKPISPEEMARRREAARQKLANKEPIEEPKIEELKLEERDLDGTAFVAFARVFSGTLKPGKTVYVLGPKYDPRQSLAQLANSNNEDSICDEKATIHDAKSKAIMKAKIENIYLLLGRELEELNEAKAGNIIGIGGLENYILKSATLSSNLACTPFVEITQSAAPILRVAVEPELSSDLTALSKGLHLLNQADANVQVFLNDKGEHILLTAGEVHLERCIRDLRETYAQVEVNVSSPIVPFRETIIEPPKTDMVNEELNEENKVVEDKSKEKVLELSTPNKQCTIKLLALPLPKEAIDMIEDKQDLLKAVMNNDDNQDNLTEESIEIMNDFKVKLKELLNQSLHEDLHGIDISSFGPRKTGANILIDKSGNQDKLFKTSLEHGFQLATLAGPLCEEPLSGCAFICTSVTFHEDVEDNELFGPLSGQIVSIVKEGCRKAFQAHPQRLMAAMYSCDITVKADVLGKMYAVLNKRHGKIVTETMIEGSSNFTVTAHLPVIESFDFAGEIRKQTSGLAMPQLVFSHWETVEIDPFWIPQTEEELLHFGDKADSDNHARKYMNEVRKKKGLVIDEKIVEFAEKQRTMTRNK